ncbi:hypothetical protein H1O16_gp329 [Burkholderia phage BcepSaruman]|uniref:Uncharacterized protein n=1 Tax=Burkholderia phage BcepSaruman TaxID=2530032 RepID=A0A4D5ZGW0_9CAUD|nr:hypothetical protein H1O16_gp329 [Burkholderia phage BcepSaruman]QBX06742.1 hypothetical protein BcepSaruman_329 [Burkholderia phage BcepSaruman]
MKDKRYDARLKEYVESPAHVEAFLDEYEALCQKFGLSLSHEDAHGGFIIEEFHEYNMKWVREASMQVAE